MIRKIALALTLLLAVCIPASSQFTGELSSGRVLGNPSASQGRPQNATLTAMFDRAFCSTPQSYLARWAAGWVCTRVTYDNRNDAVTATIPVGPKVVRLLGYVSFMDGGEDALYSLMACPAVTLPDFQSADGQCWHLNNSEVRLTYFGADRTGVSASTVPINGFVTYIQTYGRCGRVTAGTYLYAGPITIAGNGAGNALCIQGDGPKAVTFKNSNSTGNDFVFDTTTTGFNSVKFGGFTLDSNSTKTTGYAIAQLGANGINSQSRFHDIFMSTKTYGGISITSANNIAFDNVTVYNVGADARGVSFVGTGGGTINGVSLHDIAVVQGASGGGGGVTTGVYLGAWVFAVQANNTRVEGGPSNMDYCYWLADTSNGVSMNAIRFVNFFGDSCGKGNLRIDGGSEISFAHGNLQYNIAGAAGCILLNGGSSVDLGPALVIRGCLRRAINVGAGMGVGLHIIGNHIYDNGHEGAASNVYPDIEIANNVEGFSISNNNFEQVAGVPNRCGVQICNSWNVVVTGATHDNYQIVDNLTTSFVTGAVQDNGTGVRKNVSGNSKATWQTWTTAISCAAGGPPTNITAPYARYQARGPLWWINVSLLLTDIGGCTGALQFTLPSTASGQNSILNAINISTITRKNAIVAAGTNRVDVVVDGGAFPGVNTNTINITGGYESAP